MNQSELYEKFPSPLISLLNLDDSWNEQDWEWIVSDEERVEEFIKFYSTMPLNDNDRMSLMMIILDSYNTRVWQSGFDNNTWAAISNLIRLDLPFFKEQIIYWSSMDYSDDIMDDAWAIAPNMRVLMRQLHENQHLSKEDIEEDWTDDAKKGCFC